MEIRKMHPARGWTWIKQGSQLILRKPLQAISLALTAALILFFALRLPAIGPLVAVLFMPLLMTGYMRVCRALEEDEEVVLIQLFAGFQQHTARLISLGGLFLLGLLLASMLMMLVGGEPLSKLLEAYQSNSNPQLLMDAMLASGSGVSLSLMLGFALVCLLMMAVQYAPMLVYFNEITPLAALRASLSGSLRNLIPYTVYSLLIQFIGIALSIVPFGIGLIVLLPLGLTSLYVSYRNIFPLEDELTPSTP